MESTGTYGDALRQALSDAGLSVHRVSGKAAHDYAEIFDGVPSKHDGKDAAIGVAGGGPGVSAGWESDGEVTAIVLANLDPPAGDGLAMELFRALPRR